jgi:predicted nucleic acid-binding protein
LPPAVSDRARQGRRLADWLLDTNAISALMRQDAAVIAQLSRLAEADTVYLSVVVPAEIRFGIHRMPAGRRKKAVEQAYELLLPQVGPLLEVTREVSETYARTKAALEQRGIILPENDVWIAATALVNHLTLVTDDGHFAAVPGLSVENWRRGVP